MEHRANLAIVLYLVGPEPEPCAGKICERIKHCVVTYSLAWSSILALEDARRIGR